MVHNRTYEQGFEDGKTAADIALKARLAEAAVKINNVAECLAYGMDPKACEAELRLIAKGAGYGPTDSASLEPKP